MEKVRSKSNGSCPYCGGSIFTPGESRRPNQKIQQCGSVQCAGYSVLDIRSGTRYPLHDKSNPASLPYI